MPRQTVCFPIPMPEEDETLDVAVTLNGKTQLTQYRVETVRWSAAASPDARFQTLQAFIQDYDDDWELVQIGAPGRDVVPVTFRKRDAGAPAEDA